MQSTRPFELLTEQNEIRMLNIILGVLYVNRRCYIAVLSIIERVNIYLAKGFNNNGYA